MRIGEARKPGPPGDIDDPAPAYDMDESDAADVEDSHGMFSQPDEELSAALNSALARSLEQRIFTPAVAFRGARPGTVYKSGAQGLECNRDTPLAERPTASPRAFEETDAGPPPVLIALSELLEADGDEPAPRRTRR